MKKAIESLKKIYKTNKQLLLYLFFGVCTTAINTICYGVLYALLYIDNITSTIIAWMVAVIFAFITNKVYVFESQRTKRSERLKEFTSFFSCRILTGVLDIAIMAVTVDYLKWNSLVWKLISNIIVTIINYVASKFVIFKNNKISSF